MQYVFSVGVCVFCVFDTVIFSDDDRASPVRFFPELKPPQCSRPGLKTLIKSKAFYFNSINQTNTHHCLYLICSSSSYFSVIASVRERYNHSGLTVDPPGLIEDFILFYLGWTLDGDSVFFRMRHGH